MAERGTPADRAATLLMLGALAGCDPSEAAPAAQVWEKPAIEPKLEQGRLVWAANCRRCHAHGIEGAPRIGDAATWKERSARGTAALVASVIDGVQSKAGGEMPPRGGNAALGDAEIEAAVEFMVAASR